MTTDEIIKLAREARLPKFMHDTEDCRAGLDRFAAIVAEQALGQREWVGLTDEEIAEVQRGMNEALVGSRMFAIAIEAKLREKNGGGV